MTMESNIIDDNFENNVIETAEPLSALEQAIDYMAEEEGACFDPRHFHSFRPVSVILPLWTCGVCSQRMQSLVSFTFSSAAVQCAACGMLGHRSCAMNKNTDWKEPCPVNYKSVQASKRRSSVTETEQDNNDKKSHRQGPQIEEEENETLSVTSESQIPIPKNNSPPCHRGWSSLIPFASNFGVQHASVNDKDHNESSPPLNDTLRPMSSNSEEILFYQKDNATKPPCSSSTELHLVDGENDSNEMTLGTAGGTCRPDFTQQKLPLRNALSENEILRPQYVQLKNSKANFPFLSSANLFPSHHQKYASPNTGGQDDSLIGIGKETQPIIMRSHTWDGCTRFDSNEQVNQTSPSSSTSTSVNDVLDESSNDALELPPKDPLQWTADGPPPHWATGKSLETLLPPLPSSRGHSMESGEEASSLHFSSHPFECVSRALHENILVLFRPVVGRMLQNEEQDSKDGGEISPADLDDHRGEVGMSTKPAQTPPTAGQSTEEMEGLLKESQPKSDAMNYRRLGLATVAGSIAGGMAGLVFAGPVGCVIGAKLGQTAGVLGVVLEGSVAIGVITSGIAAGRHAGQQLQDRLDQNRVLALGVCDGTKQRFLLVRPSVQTDPAWETLYATARQSYTKGSQFSLNLMHSGSAAAHRQRYERDMDIVTTDEVEIPTADKVLLLVSRILNNKESLPGYIYRELIDIFRERCKARPPLSEFASMRLQAERDKENDKARAMEVEEMSRARRQDAHAVIKYVTATLLEVRPGFAASPSVTELTATAVEGLVFGEIYSLVIEEIEAAYDEQDNDLLEKIAAFERSEFKAKEGDSNELSLISESALEALHCLPEAHSASDKLRFCVTFLEKISDFFSNSDSKQPMGADSLLKMVCQHILAAKIFGINAQIAFLEDFARDEQLLRGKEGYALVTLQASLHFLNSSADFERDIFGQEDD